MLAALLPGLRDLRTPLAVGYLLLVVIWLLIHDRLPTGESATGLIADVIDVSQALGQVSVLAALTFVAYLLGMIFAQLLAFTGRLLRRFYRRLIPAEHRGTFTSSGVVELLHYCRRQLSALGDPSITEIRVAFIDPSSSHARRMDDLEGFNIRARACVAEIADFRIAIPIQLAAIMVLASSFRRAAPGMRSWRCGCRSPARYRLRAISHSSMSNRHQ